MMVSSFKENTRPIEFRLLSPELERSLADFFTDIRANGDDEFFHPHPFTSYEAQCLANYWGHDLYYVLVSGGIVLGYGMLRGWDEGFDIPSLGIIIRKRCRGLKMGRMFMMFLHAAAKYRGATKVRLTVKADNYGAIKLYESLGYDLKPLDESNLIGFIEL